MASLEPQNASVTIHTRACAWETLDGAAKTELGSKPEGKRDEEG